MYGLIYSSYSSGQGFAADFLQIPPRDGHPCLKLMVATANPIADFHCQVITHAGRTRFPRLHRRGTVKTQAVLVLFLLLLGIEHIFESLLC